MKSKRKTTPSKQKEVSPVVAVPLSRRVLHSLLENKYFLLLISAVFVTVYSSGLRNRFTFDDYLAITGNDDSYWDRKPIRELFFHDFWGRPFREIVSNDSYRPLIILTFRAQHFIMGYHSPTFLRLFNYSVAYINTILLFFVVRALCVSFYVRRGTFRAGKCMTEFVLLSFVPAWTAALFAAHPVHVEAVTSIVGRSELICFLFGSISFLLLCRFLGTGRLSHLAYSVFCLVVSVMGKDSGITFGALFILHTSLQYLLKNVSKRALMFVTVAFSSVVVSYFVFRRSFIGSIDLSKSPLIRRTENPQYFIPEGALPWLSMRWIILIKNLELAFFPSRLCCEYSYNCIPQLASTDDPRFAPYVALTAFLLCGAGWVSYEALFRLRRLPLLLLTGMAWFAIPYTPVSHIFVKVGTFIAERCLYLPSVGSSMLVVLTTTLLSPQRSRLLTASALLGVLLSSWGVLTFRRNFDWYDDASLFAAAAKVCPNSGKVRYLAAQAKMKSDANVTEETVEEFKAAYALDPEAKDPLAYIGAYLWNNGQRKEGYQMLRECSKSPFTFKMCYEHMAQMRAALHPGMSAHDMAVDNVELTVENTEKAFLMRQAALGSYEESLFCRAYVEFEQALDYWALENIFWGTAGNDPARNSFANTLYWYSESFRKCLEESESERSTTKMTHFLEVAVEGGKKTMTNWSKIEELIKDPGFVETVTNRLSDHYTTMNSIIQTVAFMEPYLKDKGELELANLKLVSFTYCGRVLFMNNDVLNVLKRENYSEQVSSLLPAFSEESLEYIKNIDEYRRKSAAQLYNQNQSMQEELKAILSCWG
ncbi:Domain of unknown function (DUF1736), putative [Angomonas deanei]|uniref:DUF1736 domain-containing protein n=1 Tax=Angomonas deanei TaxID=59799 RepID=A0A7G2C669_9TRYP|nr:Domain of unknown function (DUF1736), putative [Angomonas deanei]